MINSLSVPLKWEAPRAKESLPLIKAMPYRIQEREQIAKTISFDALYAMNDVQIDKQYQRQCKWKSLRHIYSIIRQPRHIHHSFESALFKFNDPLVTMEHFTVSVIAEYRFPPASKMDAHLKWLFWAFDTNRSNRVDWRDILAHFKLLSNFRYIRERTIDLLLILIDIYAEGGEPGTKAIKDDFVVKNPVDVLYRVAFIPCELDQEISELDPYVHELAKVLEESGYKHSIQRRHFQLILQSKASELVRRWSLHAWDRLSTDLRLTILDESQVHHKDQAEIIIGRYKLAQALLMYHRNVLKWTFKEWRSITIRATGTRLYTWRKNNRKKRRFLRFWLYYAHRRAIKRKRRTLAEVMGAYAIKARCFQRIKLFSANIRRIEKISGSLHKRARQFQLAACHLREFDRLHSLKTCYHRWWNMCVEEHNLEVAKLHDRHRQLRRCVRPWFTLAHEQAMILRQDLIARENKITFDRRMEETELAMKELFELEAQRNARLLQEQKEREQAEKDRKMEEYKVKVKMEKYTEKRLLENIQRDARNQRIAKELKEKKKAFKKEWQKREQECVLKAKERVAAYLGNKENEQALEMKFEVVKREFFAYPTPETRERERTLASYRNIMFLYIDAKMRYEGLTLEKIIQDSDRQGKGYITFAEMTQFVRSLNTCLNEAQMTSAIRSTDRSRDKEVSLQELQQGIQRVQDDRMGVVGSPWKIYIDPTEDVICYHNFQTSEKVLEYQMMDPILHRIIVDDMYGAAEHQAHRDFEQEKLQAWEKILKDYMVRRIQFMYRYWKGKQYRKKRLWKISQRLLREKTRAQRFCAKFLEKAFIGRKVRQTFHKQYQLTVERVLDTSTGLDFYYNHHTQESSWEKPWLALRYGPLPPPLVWLPMEGRHPGGLSRETEAASAAVAVAGQEAVVVYGDQEGEGEGEDVTIDPQALWLTEDGTQVVVPYEGSGRTETADGGTASTAWGSAPSSSWAVVTQASGVSYWHAKARRAVPFKPDGFILCDKCQYLLAIRTCVQCTVHTLEDGRRVGGHFCFSCHRASHAHPLGFCQRTKASKKQYMDPGFIERYKNFKHTWIETTPHRCDMCKQSKLNAAYLCQTCRNKKMCRTCFHRIHQHDIQNKHYYYNI